MTQLFTCTLHMFADKACLQVSYKAMSRPPRGLTSRLLLLCNPAIKPDPRVR